MDSLDATVVLDIRGWDRVHLFIHEVATLRDDMVTSASPFADRLSAAIDRFYADIHDDEPEVPA